MFDVGLSLMVAANTLAYGGDASLFFEFGPHRFGFIASEATINLHLPGELAVREPSMCEGGAITWLSWDRVHNKVLVGGVFDGLPYRPDLCHEVDPSTDYNEYPMCVEDGQWQIWLVGRLFTRTSVFYYDATTGDLLGNEFEFDEQPASTIAVDLPVVQMICTPTFESHPGSLFAAPFFELDYDQLRDSHGDGGAFVTFLPFNLFEPEHIDYYQVAGGLPLEEAMHMDEVLDDIENGTGGILFALSYEEVPKPDNLRAIANAMTGWGSMYPQGVFPEVEPPSACGTYQVPHGLPPGF